jgi:ABC-type sugar transport system permease subunit
MNSLALYFSLSTMATIGYGTSDYYFGDCWTPFILVLLQVFSAIVFSSLAVGLLFQRISRGQKRGRTIVFSDAAVIRKVGGR